MGLLFTTDRKVYLNELPEFNEIIRNFCENLELPTDYFTDFETEALECRSRDGFCPAYHNHGGWERTLMGTLQSVRFEFDYLDFVSKAVDYWYRILAEDHPNWESLPDEPRWELEDSYMEETVWLGVRCMYEGSSSGIHTLVVYVGGSTGEYEGPFGRGSAVLLEQEIRFRTASGLLKQLQALQKKVDKIL